MNEQPQRIIDIEAFCRQSPFLNMIKGAVVPFAEGPLRLGRFDEDVRAWQAMDNTRTPFRNSLDVIGVEPVFDGPGLELLDPAEPHVVVANHAFGAVEAVVLGRLMEQQGCDVKIMGTQFLDNIEPLSPYLISVDSFDPSLPKARNLAPLRASIKALRERQSLVIFPAGIVSHFHLSSLSVRDPDWSHHAMLLARRTSTKIVPVYVHGRNSLLFNALGMVHPLLRSLMLVREFYRQNATGQVRATIGRPLGADEIARLPDDDIKATAWLKHHVYALGRQGHR